MRNPKTFYILRVVDKSKRQVKFAHLMMGEFSELSEAKTFCEKHELGESRGVGEGRIGGGVGEVKLRYIFFAIWTLI